ncbi:MAG: hypothetical protein ABI678_12925 [Kofleriaceae bacterium]
MQVLVIGVVVAATSTAHALKPAVHAEVTTTSCRAAGLGANLCARIATEDYNTDAHEWSDLRAHAQIDEGQTACTAADATAQRMFGLGSELRVALSEVASGASEDRVGRVDALIGRALHTIQDDCAHHGMPNPQHAWFSLGDYCDGTATSPDLDPDALACARTETAAVMSGVAAAIRNAGLAPRLDGYSCPEVSTNGDHGSTQTVCQQRSLPGPFDACDFLGEAKTWDGIDRTWNNALVAPALRGAFTAGLAGAHAPPALCGGDESRIANPVSKSIVEIARPPHCAKASLLCLGKADDSDNPFADDPPSDEAVGCNAGGGSGLGLALLVVLRTSRRRRGGRPARPAGR